MELIYQDDDVLVCVKPAGVLSTDEPGGVPELARQALGDTNADVRTVHRLDAVVSGLMVLAYNRSGCAVGEAIGEYVALKDLLRRSDIVSLHCPLTAENRHMINKDTLAMMKTGAILLNTARGPLIEEQALYDALSSGKLRFAAADVAATEPMPIDSLLLKCPNCILTPHMAWAPVESRQRILDCTVASIRAFLAGAPENTVNGF